MAKLSNVKEDIVSLLNITFQLNLTLQTITIMDENDTLHLVTRQKMKN